MIFFFDSDSWQISAENGTAIVADWQEMNMFFHFMVISPSIYAEEWEQVNDI